MPVAIAKPMRHGNWKHGSYSVEGIASRRETRAFIRWIKGRGPRPLAPLPGEGWRLWQSARGTGRLVRHLPRVRARGEVAGLPSPDRLRAAYLAAEVHGNAEA